MEPFSKSSVLSLKSKYVVFIANPGSSYVKSLKLQLILFIFEIKSSCMFYSVKSFGSKLKERRVYFGKRSKALSHEMKGALYSELIKTTRVRAFLILLLC